MAKPGCRDCADEYGTCPHDGLPCDPDARRLLQLEADLERVTQERDEAREGLKGVARALGWSAQRAWETQGMAAEVRPSHSGDRGCPEEIHRVISPA